MSEDTSSGYIFRANIRNCFVSDWNPRKTISTSGIDELAEGVKVTGVVQPPLARVAADDPDRIEIVAGQRRFLAAQAAGQEYIDVILRPMTDEDAAIVACQENDQREDLPPLDEAAMYRRMMESFGWDPATLGARVGRSQAYVYRRLNLSECLVEPPLRDAFNRGGLSVENARKLAGLSPRLQKEAVRFLSLELDENKGYSTENVTNVMRKLTPRATAEDFLARAAGEQEHLLDDKNRDECMDSDGNLLPESIYVDIEGKPDIAELKPNITPRKWYILLEEAGCDSETVPVYRVVDKKWGCHRLIERELAKDAIMANKLTIFRSAPVSVDHAERLEAERAENLLWKKEWALVKEIVTGLTENLEGGGTDLEEVCDQLNTMLETRVRGLGMTVPRLGVYLAPLEGIHRLIVLCCFVGCDDLTNDRGVHNALESLLQDPKAILKRVEAECEAKRPDAPAKKKRSRKKKEVEA